MTELKERVPALVVVPVLRGPHTRTLRGVGDLGGEVPDDREKAADQNRDDEHGHQCRAAATALLGLAALLELLPASAGTQIVTTDFDELSQTVSSACRDLAGIGTLSQLPSPDSHEGLKE